jgi:toxin ParE1/3/4
MPRVIRTRRARIDLLDILTYVRERNRTAADRLAKEIKEKCAMLARFPAMGREREELAPDLRSHPVGKYVIFYRSIKNGIEIIRVLHGARDIPPLFEDY